MATTAAARKPEEVSKDAASIDTQAPLPKGASLYIGDLDSNVREEQLIELFRPVGPLLGVRICRDIITQRSLGYAYVNFQNPEDAEKALTTLNFTMVGTKHIRLMWQQRDPTLRYSGVGNIFVKNLQDTLDHSGLFQLFKDFGSIMSCKVMKDKEGKSLGYGFVHFKEEDAASKAIDSLNGSEKEAAVETAAEKKDAAVMSPEEAKKLARKHALYVAHFIRRNARIAALLANFTNVYIKQVLPNVDKSAIEKFFSKFGGITSSIAKKDSKGRAFAFCNFGKHEDAVKAIESLHGKKVDGLTAEEHEGVFVQRAQSRSERLFDLRQRYMQRQALGNNLYIRNFDPDFSEENLRELFKEFGDLSSCKVMTDAKGNSRGFGFISFGSAEQANHALREMNGRMLNGKPLVVNIAQRRDHRYSMLQVQFQQRIQALLQRLPMMPFIAGGGGGPRAPMLRAMKKPQTSQAAASNPNRQHVGAGGKKRTGKQNKEEGAFPSLTAVGGSASNAPPAAHETYTMPRAKPAAEKTEKAAKPASKAAAPKAAAVVTSSTKPASKPASEKANSTTTTPSLHPATPPFTAIDKKAILELPREEQKVQLGEALFLKISEITEENAPKITGMFLEMEAEEILALLSNHKELNTKIEEALCVLKAHQLKREA